MTVVSVLYPRTLSSRFDHAYYMSKHIPLAKARFGEHGLQKLDVLRSSPPASGEAPAFELIALLYFPSQEVMDAALAAHGEEVLGDIPNFTDVHPILQVNAPVEE